MNTHPLKSTMKRIALIATMAVLLPLSTFAEDTKSNDGFRPLFNGKDLKGWNGDSDLWSVQDGAIVGSTHDREQLKYNQFLSTSESFSDFELRVKVKMESGNSGIQFRSDQYPDQVVKGYQADVAEKTYFGMLYEEGKRGIMPYWKALSDEERAAIFNAAKIDDWNQYVITCKGDHIKMVLNGYTTLDIDDPDGAKKGIIALQMHRTDEPMRVFFKDIEIKEFKQSTYTYSFSSKEKKKPSKDEK